jgi:hypothetical protein
LIASGYSAWTRFYFRIGKIPIRPILFLLYEMPKHMSEPMQHEATAAFATATALLAGSVFGIGSSVG